MTAVPPESYEVEILEEDPVTKSSTVSSGFDLEIEIGSILVTGETGPDTVIEIPTGDPIPGPEGQPGIVRVHHGTNANVARPDAAVVYWIGTAAPINAESWDFQVQENI